MVILPEEAPGPGSHSSSSDVSSAVFAAEVYPAASSDDSFHVFAAWVNPVVSSFQ